MIIDGIFTNEEIRLAKAIKRAKYLAVNLTYQIRYVHEYFHTYVCCEATPEEVRQLRRYVEDIDSMFCDLCEKKNKKEY